jgi:hypothetical protein
MEGEEQCRQSHRSKESEMRRKGEEKTVRSLSDSPFLRCFFMLATDY